MGIYADPTNLCQHSTTDLARGIMTNERKQSALSKGRSFKHSKTMQTAFLYSIYHQRAGKTSLFPMRGVDFTHFNICCIPLSRSYEHRKFERVFWGGCFNYKMTTNTRLEATSVYYLLTVRVKYLFPYLYYIYSKLLWQ